MRADEYVGSIVVKNKLINIGMDDYGQQYFFEFVNDKGEKEEVGCGAYNEYYIDEILSYFDNKGYYISKYGKKAWDDETETLTQVYLDRSKKYKDDPEHLKMIKEWYTSNIERRKTESYSLYDIEALYKQIEENK